MKKRGLSGVVTTVLMVLLVLAAVVIVWSFVKPVITQGSSKISTDAVTTSISVQKNSVVVTNDEDEETTSVELNVRRNVGGGEVIGYNIILDDENGKREVIRRNANIAELESDNVVIDNINFPNSLDNLGKVVKISVAPIVKGQDGKEVVLGVTSSFDVGSGAVVDSGGSGNGGSGEECVPTTEICGNGIDEDCDGSDEVCAPTIPTNGLVSYWKFDSGPSSSNGISSSFDDSAGGSAKLHCSIQSNSCPTLETADAKFGNAMNFDGNDYAIDDEPPTYVSSSSGTFSAWANFDVPASSSAEVIMGAGNFGSTNYISLRKNNENNIVMRYNSGSNYEATFGVSSGWHHYVGTWDSSTGEVKLYVDGSQEAVRSGVVFTSFGFSWIRVGAREFGGAGLYIKGKIDEVMIYDRSLNSDEIADICKIQNNGIDC